MVYAWRGCRFDYTTVGHVTADVMADGTRRPGGSAFYSALQAARLGRRALILTRGVRDEIEELLAPYRGELELELAEAPRTTTLQTSGAGRERGQRMLAWAGPIAPDVRGRQRRSCTSRRSRARRPSRWRGRGGLRRAHAAGARARVVVGAGRRSCCAALEPSLLPERCDAIVLSAHERASCCSGAARRRATRWSARDRVTDGRRRRSCSCRIGDPRVLEVPRSREPLLDDIGAGDVFAAAFFVALADGEDAPRGAASSQTPRRPCGSSGVGAGRGRRPRGDRGARCGACG